MCLTTQQSSTELYDTWRICEGLELGIRSVRIARKQSCLVLGEVPGDMNPFGLGVEELLLRLNLKKSE
jgi:hypothetical protein